MPTRFTSPHICSSHCFIFSSAWNEDTCSFSYREIHAKEFSDLKEHYNILNVKHNNNFEELLVKSKEYFVIMSQLEATQTKLVGLITENARLLKENNRLQEALTRSTTPESLQSSPLEGKSESSSTTPSAGPEFQDVLNGSFLSASSPSAAQPREKSQVKKSRWGGKVYRFCAFDLKM
jgi:hypothetical protein